jgi:glycosyltransferase involved in cell wall biosynthesis
MQSLSNLRERPLSVAIVTSIHPDFDARIWKHARMLAEAGNRVRLVCPWNVVPESVVDGVELHPFPKAPSRLLRPVWSLIKLMPTLGRILRDTDIVHFHDLDLLPWMIPIALIKPVVFDVHENYPDEMLEKVWIPTPLRRPASLAVKWGQWLGSRIIRNVVLVAPSQERYFSAPALRKIYVSNFASRDLADSAANNYADRKPLVVFIGSQHENNGSLLLLDVAALVVANNPAIRFVAVDRFFDPVFRERFMERRRVLGLEGAVRLVPNVRPQELMSILNEATVGISPNLRVPQQINGIHTKVFEYMAAGLPMVLSDLPHQLEIVGHSGAGFAVPPERPEDFARAVLDLVADPARAADMGRRGQAAFRAHYCYESQKDKLIEYYQRILAGAL